MQSKTSHNKRLSLTLVAFVVLTSILLITSVSAGRTNGPHFDRLEFLTIKSPDSQVKAMKLGQIDMYPRLIRPRDVEELSAANMKVVSTAGGTLASFIFNIREYQTDEPPYVAYGDPPHYDKRCLRDPWFRLAVSYLTPKNLLLGKLFKYLAIRIDSVCPPQLGKWHNLNVPTYHYDPAKAVQTLLDHGYQRIGSPPDWYWAYDDGTPLGHTYGIDFLSPCLEQAPTSYTIVKTTVEEMHKIGLTNIEHLPVPWPCVEIMVFHYFDMYFHLGCVGTVTWAPYWTGGLGPYPDHMWALFHSSQAGWHGLNHAGTNDPYLDSLAETVHTSMDEDEIKDACWEMQMLVADPNQWYGMCYIPIYSRNFFDAYQPDLDGVVNMPLAGSDNGWTFLNMRWKDGTGPHGDNSIVYVLGTELGSLNPLVSNSADEVEVWGKVFGGLMGSNPYSLEDIYAQADYRKIEEYTGDSPFGPVDGMKFTYNLRSGLKWHTGVPFTTEDVKFAFDKMAEWQPGLWINAWQKYVGTNIINSTMFEIYYNKTSLWLKDTVEVVACLLPKQIWEGVTDWQHFDLWKETYYDGVGNPIQIPGASAGHYVKKLCGTGSWIFDYNDPDEMYTAFYPNPNYHQPQTEIENQLHDMFYWFGDVNKDAKAEGSDLVEIGLGWAAIYPDPRYKEHKDADLNRDYIIDIQDAKVTGFAFGKKKWY